MRSARKLLIVFLVVTALPAAFASWLVWRLIEQDAVISRERSREIRERRADDVVQGLSRTLRTLAQEAQGLPRGGVYALGGRLAYAVDPRLLPEAPSRIFSIGEEAEFRTNRWAESAGSYRKLTMSREAAVRAGAWLRLGRVLRKLGRPEEAIQAYRQLSKIDAVAAGGAPAQLVGLWAICDIHEETSNRDQLKTLAVEFSAALDSSQYALGRDTYEAYAEDAARWSGKARPVLSEALSDAAGSRPAGAGAGQFRGQLITWLVADSHTVLMTPDYVERLMPVGPVRVRFATHAEKDETLRRADETALPWSLAISLTDPANELKSLADRRRLLFWLLAAVAVFGIGGAYLAWRLIRRELALAQMQTDIVAAVSHEFRTPLTSMRQISAALSEGRVPEESRRQAYYDALTRATSRLHRLVEDLLDFGRMEADAMQFRMEPLDLGALAGEIASDFQGESSAKEFTIHTSLGADPTLVQGDPEALRRALWNLLDNAVKYSGESREVWLRMSSNGGEVCVSVQDNGLGIPIDEQPDVFQKFFRGAASRQYRIYGSGIGLAILNHIVQAHGGRVTLESRPGAGSTFSVHLPVKE